MGGKYLFFCASVPKLHDGGTDHPSSTQRIRNTVCVKFFEKDVLIPRRLGLATKLPGPAHAHPSAAIDFAMQLAH
jgi:hypothetical protein